MYVNRSTGLSVRDDLRDVMADVVVPVAPSGAPSGFPPGSPSGAPSEAVRIRRRFGVIMCIRTFTGGLRRQVGGCCGPVVWPLCFDLLGFCSGLCRTD